MDSLCPKKLHRDFRKARSPKLLVKLVPEDFKVIKKKDIYRLEIPDHIENMIVLNKHVERRFIEIYSENF